MTTTEADAGRTRSGLFARDRTPVPLQGVSVHALVNGDCAKVTIAQRYLNTEAHPIEAVYVFPLEEGAAVCGFTMLSGGRAFVGVVKPRDEAFDDYDKALERGDIGTILDQERADVFRVSVGNVPAGGEVTLQLTYVTELVSEGTALRFTLPTTVSPRYAPAEDRSAIGEPAAEVLNPPVSIEVPYGLQITLEADLPGAITRVESPSHPISVSMSGTHATVSLSHERTAMDRDFILVMDAEQLGTSHAVVERTPDGTHAVMLAIRPNPARTGSRGEIGAGSQDVAPIPSEIIFVIDRSGSMAGSSIAEVRNALQLCLRSLPPGARFNIVGFGSTYESLFEHSVEYGERHLSKASAHVVSLEANLGGTEILPALQAVFALRPAEGLARQVVVLTDGEVTNTDAVIALVTKHARDARVFTFGIGRGASTHLVRAMARAGNGTAEFIYPGERIEPKVMRQFARLLAPAYTNVNIAWGANVRQAPTVVPPVFAGHRTTVYALVDGPLPASVRVSARGADGPIAIDVPIDPAHPAEGRTVATLAARGLIRELEESPEWLASRGSRQAGRRADRANADIVRLATEFQLASRETSFVAIERRETPVEGESVLRRIPILLTSGWGGEDRWDTGAVLAACAPPPAAPMPTFRFARMLERTASSSVGRSLRARLFDQAAPPPASHSAASSLRPLDQLVALQRADGSWDLTDELAAIVQRPARDLHQALRRLPPAPEAARVWATALALAWLVRGAIDERDEWRLLADKARRWLEQAVGGAARASEWLAEATTYLDR